jgi:hypothetical protein
MKMTATMNSTRTFGVELEIVGISQQQAAAAITAAGLVCYAESYNHQTRGHWKVISDSSVFSTTGMCREAGCEVVSPVLCGEQGMAQLEKVCKALEAAGAKVNKTCGMHVHVGAADLNAKQVRNVVKTWVKYEDSTNLLVSESRRGYDTTGYLPSYYCRDNVRTLAFGQYSESDVANVELCRQMFNQIDACKTIDQLTDLFGGHDGTYTRYHKLNLASYYRHRTIEVRCHQGTVNARKATEWVRFCLGLVETSASRGSVQPRKAHGHSAADRLGYLLDAAGLTASSKRFFRNRAKQLSREVEVAA